MYKNENRSYTTRYSDTTISYDQYHLLHYANVVPACHILPEAYLEQIDEEVDVLTFQTDHLRSREYVPRRLETERYKNGRDTIIY